MTTRRKIKVAVGKNVKELELIDEGKSYACIFGFNRPLMAQIKAMEGARWHGFDEKPRKVWTIKKSECNEFRLRYMQFRALSLADKQRSPDLNPYYIYDEYTKNPTTIDSKRPLYDHQKEMAGLILAVHNCIISCEMGTGKTLAAIEAVEHIDPEGEVWYVGPKSGVKAVERELIKWDCKIPWRMITYEGLVNLMAKWDDGDPAPQCVIFDESSKIKTPSTQRSQAAYHLATAVRAEYGKNGYIVEMSGTPAPKDPTDWWHQVHVARPGFLTEGRRDALKKRMCLIEQRENNITGGMYPHVITWWDDVNKCQNCGLLPSNLTPKDVRPCSCGKYARSVNEVEKLGQRLNGLRIVKFADECLDLPELRFEEIMILPAAETLRAEKLIAKSSPRVITALTLIRELSDGFQYTEEVIGTEQCPNCHGSGECQIQILPDGPVDAAECPVPNTDIQDSSFETVTTACDLCGATGTIERKARSTEIVGSPKDQYFIDDLDQHEDDGRYLVWGGFTGTIDRLVTLAHQQGWWTLRVDGRGYHVEGPMGEQGDADEALNAMDASHKDYRILFKKFDKLCFVGHPQAGGMALTLTASRTSLFYSNSYDGTARMQAIKRGHRAGMPNRAHTIKDLIHLKTDKIVLDNLKTKMDLQDQSLGRNITKEELLDALNG